jgi:hypothetical protein
MKRQAMFAAALMLTLAVAVNAVPVQYSFDTVTAVRGFIDNTNVSYRYVVNRCVPLFLLAMEKPGRYRLKITVDADHQNVQLKTCRLELR